METTRLGGRAVALAFGFAAITSLSASPATACESEYIVQPGDTLGAIAVRCDTTVAALAEANEVDPRRLQLGQTLAIPGVVEDDGPVVRESARRRDALDDTAAAAEDSAIYRVKPGDSLAGIARELGVGLEMLQAVNPGLDPRRLRIGQSVRVPNTEEVAAVLAEQEAEREREDEMRENYRHPKLWAEDGAWRRTVDLEAAGLAPGETVRIAVSAGGGEWLTLGDMKADENGELEARARIPVELDGVSSLTFAMQRPWGEHVALDYREGDLSTARRERAEQDIEVAASEPDDAAEGDRVSIAGKVVRGGDCAMLVTPEGNFAVAGGSALEPGSRVQVIGRRSSDAAGCEGAQASIEVASARLL